MFNNLLKPLFFDIKKFILETFFPIVCVWCEKEGLFLCLDCQNRIANVDKQRCIICHDPSPFGYTHSRCKTPWAPDGLVSFFDYHDKKIAKLIIDGKYNFIPAIYEFLGLLVSNKIKQSQYSNIFDPSFILTPVPLYKLRKRWRGFNQSEILCLQMGTILKIKYSPVLIKVRTTKTQKNLKKADRKNNILGAFDVTNKKLVKNQNFILVDDVITTGSTILEAAHVLKRNGANKVWCLAAARD